jgi:hypothetical protein
VNYREIYDRRRRLPQAPGRLRRCACAVIRKLNDLTPIVLAGRSDRDGDRAVRFLEGILHMSMLTPHGVCLSWQPELIWLNAVSDAMVAVAFFATACVLGFYVWRRRREVMFRGVFWALAIFTAVCGVTRLLSILTLWMPASRA